MRHVDRSMGVAAVALSVALLSACSSLPVTSTEVAAGSDGSPGAALLRVLVRPASQTRRDSATGAFAAIAMGLRPLELERSAMCMDAGALYRTPEARRQLAPRLLATGGRRLGVVRRPLALVTRPRGLPSRRDREVDRRCEDDLQVNRPLAQWRFNCGSSAMPVRQRAVVYPYGSGTGRAPRSADRSVCPSTMAYPSSGCRA